MNKTYNESYFKWEIFDYDYEAIAGAIIDQYDPKCIIEFGCGNGYLANAFLKKGIEVYAIDGFANPEFYQPAQINFTKINLNDTTEVTAYLKTINKRFDVAISLEVAEHLQPQISEEFITWITSVTDVVIFSAAIPEQGGDGHINCRPRDYWNSIFETHQFFIADTIRSKIRSDNKVATWYKLNIVDYVKSGNELTAEEYKKIVNRLVATESAASSLFYKTNRELEYRKQVLNFPLVKASFNFRNFLKTILGKKKVGFSKYE